MLRYLVTLCLVAVGVLICTIVVIENSDTGPKWRLTRVDTLQDEPFIDSSGQSSISRINTHIIKRLTKASTRVIGDSLVTSDVNALTSYSCSVKSDLHKSLYASSENAFTDDWTFTERVLCPNFTVEDQPRSQTIEKVVLECIHGDAKLAKRFTNSSSDIDSVVSLNNSCLERYVKQCCYDDDNGVPNLVHYVWYFNNTLKFPTFASILSVIKFIRPCLIVFHGEYIPHGKYWDYIVGVFPNIVHVKRPKYEKLFGQKLRYHEHAGDVMRIEALQQLGGIYLDTDYIVLKPVDSFRDYDVTLCLQSSGYLLNSFIISKPNATFLSLWMRGYELDYRQTDYVYNSMVYNRILARNHSNLVHVEKGSLCRPDEMVGKPLDLPVLYNWSNLYGFHIYSRRINFPLDEIFIRNMNTTFASMLRHIVLGSKELCVN